MTCQKCGHSFEGISCPVCGTAHPPRPPFQQFHTPPAQRSDDNKVIMLICLVGVAIFALGFLAYFGFVLFAALLPLFFEICTNFFPYHSSGRSMH